MQRNAMHSPSRSSRTTVSSRNHRQRSRCSVATFAQCLVFASLLHQGAEARLHDAGNRSRRASASNETGVDLVDVVIGFEKGEVQRGGISDLELLERGGLLGLTADGARSDFRRTNAVSMQIPASEVNSLRSTTGISFVEYDAKAFMHEDEIVTTRATQETNLPWGLAAIQANSKKIPLPSPSSDCFKICIVDSGLLVEHPDIPYTRGATNIAGEEFNIGALSKWDEPIAIANHGTHVTGTMLATGTRNPRVVGVIPNNQNICLLVARVFGDEVNPGASTSTTDRAAEWCGDMGAKVINLSFGSPTFSTNSAAIYRSLRSEGVLLVSSAGNAQDNSKSYPASYSDVISVSSVDKDLQRFWTSQHNDQVDLAAPGVGIVSTVPGMGLFDELGREYSTALIDYSPFITSPLTAGVVQCGLGTEPCKDAEGRICLIQFGSNAIDDKAFHCEMGGGVAAVIYNTQFTTAPTRGAINSFVSIPVMGVSYADGLALLSKESITVDLQVPSYTEKRGTSMAAPHVAGVAAKIWAARPACSNNQVRDALEATAKDLGDPGRDDMYGHGLIQAEAAYEYLLALPAPCGIGTTGTPNTIQGSDSDSTPTASSGGNTPTASGGGSTPSIDRETFLANLAKEGTRSQANDKDSLRKSIQTKTERVRGGGGVRYRFLKGSKAKH